LPVTDAESVFRAGVVKPRVGIQERVVAAALNRAVVLHPEVGERAEREIVAGLAGLVVAPDTRVDAIVG
jgi:hypothetical protein